MTDYTFTMTTYEVQADGSLTLIDAYSIAKTPDLSIYIDGYELITDVPPQIINERTMVPVRGLSEALGYRVEWVAENQLVVVYRPEINGRFPQGITRSLLENTPLLAMQVNNPVVEVNNTERERIVIDSPPVIVDGSTLVPLGFIAEVIGFTVDWQESTRTVFLHSGVVAE